jgi:hypothetical protein
MKGHTSSMPLFDRPAPQPAAPAVPCNPTVAPQDVPRLRKSLARLLAFLSDHQWHENHELVKPGGMRFGGRLEELRGAGYPIQSEQVRGGLWRYRLLDRGEP